LDLSGPERAWHGWLSNEVGSGTIIAEMPEAKKNHDSCVVVICALVAMIR
jgi:hypothetical protein